MGGTRAHVVALPLADDDASAEASLGAPITLAALEPAPPRRPGWPTLAALAITCGIAAVGLGAWALVAETRSEATTAPATAVAGALTVLTDSEAERFPLRGSVGRITLVVAGDGRAVLTLDGLGAAPEGSTYQAWVVPPGSATPRAAGTFDASERVVPLARRVTRQALVAVTLEPAGGAERPRGRCA